MYTIKIIKWRHGNGSDFGLVNGNVCALILWINALKLITNLK